MKLDCNKNYSFNFKLGLSKSIINKEKVFDLKNATNRFAQNYGIEANFKDSKTIGTANNLVLELLEKMLIKNKINLSLPPTIFSYVQNETIDNIEADNFCISDTRIVLKNEYPFPGRSIFFKKFSSLEEIDDITNYQFLTKQTSSPHFLAPFIHEWIHSLHLDYIFKTFGYGGECDYLNQLYPNKNYTLSGISLLKQLENKALTKEENIIVYDILGKYSTKPFNQYLEIISETFTQIICNSLKNCELIKNPFDEIKNMPTSFKKILKKVCLLDDFK